MYPYYLCLHIASSRLCRQAIGQNPPQGFVKILRHAKAWDPYGPIKRYSKTKVSPYDPNDGELLPTYWSLSRVQDLIRSDAKQLDR